jgi:hypothetical protein
LERNSQLVQITYNLYHAVTSIAISPFQVCLICVRGVPLPAHPSVPSASIASISDPLTFIQGSETVSCEHQHYPQAHPFADFLVSSLMALFY